MASTCLTSQHPVGLGAPEAACSTLLSRSSCSRLITSIRKRSLQPAAVCRPIAARPSIQSLRDYNPASWTRVATRRSRNPPLSPTAAPLSRLPTATGERFLSSRISHSGSPKAGLTSRGRLIPVAIGHSGSFKASGGSNGSCRSRSDVSADVPVIAEASAEPTPGNPRDRRLDADGSRLREKPVEEDEVQREGQQGTDKRVESCGNCPSEGLQGTGMYEDDTGEGDTEADQFVMRTLLIDNYDSYTFNLYHLLADVNGVPPVVVRNNEVSWEYLRHLLLHQRLFHSIVISPGPGTPCCAADIVCSAVVGVWLSVCAVLCCVVFMTLACWYLISNASLVYGASPRWPTCLLPLLPLLPILLASLLVHTGPGNPERRPGGAGTRACAWKAQVVRYHSLAVHWASLSNDLEPIAWTTNDPLFTSFTLSPSLPLSHAGGALSLPCCPWSTLPTDLEPIAWTTNDPLFTFSLSPPPPPPSTVICMCALQVVRYHSLAVDGISLPTDLEPIAWTTNDPLSTHIASPGPPAATPSSVGGAQAANGAMIAGAEVVVNGACRGTEPGGDVGAGAPSGNAVVVNGMVAPRQCYQQEQQHEQQQEQQSNRVIMGLAHKRRPHVGVQVGCCLAVMDG
ncbi:unnamed protein product [Closterium sp. NIES-65]|nr:unnamed protein product [Closterium sp. NIES-65]